jgi:hypothetical protein
MSGLQPWTGVSAVVVVVVVVAVGVVALLPLIDPPLSWFSHPPYHTMPPAAQGIGRIGDCCTLGIS